MLRPKKNIKRREIQEDNLTIYYRKVETLFKKYSQQIQIGAIVIVVVIGVSIFMGRSKKAANFKAAGLLGVAEQYYFAQDYDRGIQELLKIVDTYPGTKSAGRATFFLGNIYFEKADYENAELYYEEFTHKYASDDLFAPSAIAGLAACLEEKELFEDAAQMFMKAAKKYPDYFQACSYYMNAARCLAMAGQKEEAKEVYALVVDEYKDSQESKDAEMFMNVL